MKICRVFVCTDGSIRIMHPNMRRWNPWECSEGEFCRKLMDASMTKDPTLAGLPYYDVDASSIPSDRSKRHAWRWADNPGVYVDETVPDPPHPKQDQLDRIERAQTVEEIKSILKEMVK